MYVCFMFVCDLCSRCWWKNSVSGMYKTLKIVGQDKPTTWTAWPDFWTINSMTWHFNSLEILSTCQVFVREKGSNCVLQVRDQLLPQRVHVTWIPDFLQGSDVVQWINQYDNKGRVIWEYWVSELLFCNLLWQVFWCINHYEPKGGRYMYLDFCMMVRNGRCPNTSGRQIKLAF